MQFKTFNRRIKSMKKVMMFVLAVVISVAFVGTAFAQTPAPKAATEKPAVAMDKAKTEKPAAATEKKAVKPKTHQFTGEVTAIDTAAKTLNVKGKKDEKAFDIANAKMKKEPAAGDKVVVKYTEADGKNVASSVTVAKAAKKAEAKKEAPKKEEKAPAAPAPAPAPAKK
jgi:hypothetical protein